MNDVAGGAGGIRTLDRALQPYNGLANRRLQPLGHSSVGADMPDTGASRKRQIAKDPIPAALVASRHLIRGCLARVRRAHRFASVSSAPLTNFQAPGGADHY